MEEQIKQICTDFLESKDSDGPRQVLEFLDSFYQNPQFFQALFTLFRDRDESHPIRSLAIIELKRQLKLHWNDFSVEFQHVFLDNIPNLIIGVTTQEPKYHLLISDLVKLLLSVSFENYFNEYWADILLTFINSDKDQFFAGLLILINVFQVIIKKGYINEDGFKTEFTPFIRQLFEKITAVYAETELTPFLKAQCILVATSVVELDPEICIDPSFMPWYECVESLTTEDSGFILPLTSETAYYMSNLVNFFHTCQRKCSKEEIPYASDLFFLCFNIMYDSSWENESNQSLIVNVFKFFAYFSKCVSTWEINFLPRLNDLIQNVFLPVFALPSEAIQLAETMPVEFINEYHVDFDIIKGPNNNEENSEEEDDSEISSKFSIEDSETPISVAFYCLRQISEKKNSDIHEFLFSIAATTLSDFMSSDEKDFAYLYSIFHMAHSYWKSIVKYMRESAVEFMDQLLPLFQESIENPSSVSSDKGCVYIFQSSLLLIISCAKPQIKDYGKNKDQIINPSYVEVCIALLDSESSLVKYFASYSLYQFLSRFNSNENNKDILEICQPDALKIIVNIIDYAKNYGKTSIADIISIFLKDNDILKSVIEHTPYLIESVFSIAASLVETNSYLWTSLNFTDLPPLFNTLMNLIDQLDKSPQDEELLCTMIFKRCIETFSTFKFYLPFYELIAIILNKSPEYVDDLYNLVFEPVVKSIPYTFSRKSSEFTAEVALILHNMMVRSPEFMLSMNSRSLQSIIDEENPEGIGSESNSNSLFEIGTIITDNDKDDVTRNMYFSALMYLIPPEEFPQDYLENIFNGVVFDDEDSIVTQMNYGYGSCVDMLLMLLKINANIFVERDGEKFLDYYIEFLSPIEIVCALSFVDPFIPNEVRNDYLDKHVVSRLHERTLINDEKNDPFDVEYKTENNNVAMEDKYFRIFSDQKRLEIAQAYLNNLVNNEPGFLEYFGEHQLNLTYFLEYQIQY